MSDVTSIERLQNTNVYDVDGDKVGSVGQVYLDDQSGQPSFVTVQTGLFGTKETFVPLDRATETAEGLSVPFRKDFIKDAPNLDADGSLSPQDEERLYQYYGLDGHAAGTPQTRENQSAGGTDAIDAVQDTDRESVVVRDEQLNVGTETRESGRVRLRKHSYTDTETVEVPVSREEVVVERESIDPNSPEALRNTGDEEVVVTTHEEVPVVDKTATAEKVTVDKNTIQDTERVSGTVQREDVEVEGEGDAGRRNG
jgi:uncharacterized protein (TIGR02271 family)